MLPRKGSLGNGRPRTRSKNPVVTDSTLRDPMVSASFTTSLPEETNQHAGTRQHREEQPDPGEYGNGIALRAESEPGAFPSALNPDHPPENVARGDGFGGRAANAVALDQEAARPPADDSVNNQPLTRRADERHNMADAATYYG